MGSTVSIAVVLVLVGLVFLLLPDHGPRLLEERRPMLMALLLAIPLAGVATTSFYGELRIRGWRYAAHGALALMLAVSLWTYWPKE